MDPLISGPDHPRWTDPQFVALAQHKQEAAMPRLNEDQVEWIVNDIAELGVKIGDQFFFLYKGRSLVYKEAEHDNGSPMHWRPVFKREFGECCHPINDIDPTKYGTVSLSDSDEWKRMPSAAPPPFDKSTIPEGYMLVPIVLPPGIVTQATPAVELRDKPGNMVERVYRSILSALQAKGY